MYHPRLTTCNNDRTIIIKMCTIRNFLDALSTPSLRAASIHLYIKANTKMSAKLKVALRKIKVIQYNLVVVICTRWRMWSEMTSDRALITGSANSGDSEQQTHMNISRPAVMNNPNFERSFLPVEGFSHGLLATAMRQNKTTRRFVIATARYTHDTMS